MMLLRERLNKLEATRLALEMAQQNRARRIEENRKLLERLGSARRNS